MTALGTLASTADLATGNDILPPGIMMPFAGAFPASGWLECDGTSYLRASYDPLFQALGGTGSPWGLPDGTHFNVPNLRDKAPVGKPAAGLAVGATGGALAHSHAVSSLAVPQHQHAANTLQVGQHQHPSGYAQASHFHYMGDYRSTNITGTQDSYIGLNTDGNTGAAAPGISGWTDYSGVNIYLTGSTGDFNESATPGGSLQASDPAYGSVVWGIKT